MPSKPDGALSGENSQNQVGQIRQDLLYKCLTVSCDIKVKSSAERLLGIVDKISDIMMDYITPDAAPSVFTTQKMNLALSKASPSQLGGKKLSLDRGNNSGDFTIPSDGKLSTLLSNTSFTSIQVNTLRRFLFWKFFVCLHVFCGIEFYQVNSTVVN